MRHLCLCCIAAAIVMFSGEAYACPDMIFHSNLFFFVIDCMAGVFLGFMVAGIYGLYRLAFRRAKPCVEAFMVAWADIYALFFGLLIGPAMVPMQVVLGRIACIFPLYIALIAAVEWYGRRFRPSEYDAEAKAAFKLAYPLMLSPAVFMAVALGPLDKLDHTDLKLWVVAWLFVTIMACSLRLIVLAAPVERRKRRGAKVFLAVFLVCIGLLVHDTLHTPRGHGDGVIYSRVE